MTKSVDIKTFNLELCHIWTLKILKGIRTEETAMGLILRIEVPPS